MKIYQLLACLVFFLSLTKVYAGGTEDLSEKSFTPRLVTADVFELDWNSPRLRVITEGVGLSVNLFCLVNPAIAPLAITLNAATFFQTLYCCHHEEGSANRYLSVLKGISIINPELSALMNLICYTAAFNQVSVADLVKIIADSER